MFVFNLWVFSLTLQQSKDTLLVLVLYLCITWVKRESQLLFQAGVFWFSIYSH